MGFDCIKHHFGYRGIETSVLNRCFMKYPYTINRMTLKTNRKIMKIIVYCIFAIYFIWMTTTYASQFYGTVPFEFFWE